MSIAIDLQDSPLEPTFPFFTANVETIHSGYYGLNEFALSLNVNFRIGIRWAYSKNINYESRNYCCRYADIFTEYEDLIRNLKKSAIEVYGENFHAAILNQLRIYLNSPNDLNIEKYWDDLPNYDEINFPFACQLVLLVAFENKHAWKSEFIKKQIHNDFENGNKRFHIEVLWVEDENPDSIEIRLLNSWENYPISVGDCNDGFPPRVLASFSDELLFTL